MMMISRPRRSRRIRRSNWPSGPTTVMICEPSGRITMVRVSPPTCWVWMSRAPKRKRSISSWRMKDWPPGSRMMTRPGSVMTVRPPSWTSAARRGNRPCGAGPACGGARRDRRQGLRARRTAGIGAVTVGGAWRTMGAALAGGAGRRRRRLVSGRRCWRADPALRREPCAASQVCQRAERPRAELPAAGGTGGWPGRALLRRLGLRRAAGGGVEARRPGVPRAAAAQPAVLAFCCRSRCEFRFRAPAVAAAGRWRRRRCGRRRRVRSRRVAAARPGAEVAAAVAQPDVGGGGGGGAAGCGWRRRRRRCRMWRRRRRRRGRRCGRRSCLRRRSFGGCLGFPSGPSFFSSAPRRSARSARAMGWSCNCMAVRAVVASSARRRFVMMLWVLRKILK